MAPAVFKTVETFYRVWLVRFLPSPLLISQPLICVYYFNLRNPTELLAAKLMRSDEKRTLEQPESRRGSHDVGCGTADIGQSSSPQYFTLHFSPFTQLFSHRMLWGRGLLQSAEMSGRIRGDGTVYKTMLRLKWLVGGGS